ncbi:hypothetical protein L6164_016728 [Bauhinia variegata]|uniref:Uncharacterized protein n=1 Tax=Bauhinia variegata TaxID=167791 RepID=A0ACB9N993_BAUVA|nr:hypothetical protein L6164_016728 [Bauhinia variegata]
MCEEMDVLDWINTWTLVDLLVGKKAIGCKWVFTVKVNPDYYVARLKARLVAKGYAHTYGVDYSKTFALVAKLTPIRKRSTWSNLRVLLLRGSIQPTSREG